MFQMPTLQDSKSNSWNELRVSNDCRIFDGAYWYFNDLTNDRSGMLRWEHHDD
jgi:hypothetical protein